MKGGARLVVSLMGVLAPGLWRRPLFYTVLEDQKHGADMVASIMLDVLLEASRTLGQLPRRFFVQADNTAKETKNTITLFAATWLLAHLQYTRLECIEFGFLVVGHTHDLIDAVFAYVSKALHGQDVLSLPELFTALNRRMRTPPMWKRLRDIWAFKDLQPASLGSHRLKGVTQPHHIRIFWSRDGCVVLQSKRWLTSSDWTAPVMLVTPAEVVTLRNMWPTLVRPAWDAAFAPAALTWLSKLRGLLEVGGRDTAWGDTLRAVGASGAPRVSSFRGSDP